MASIDLKVTLTNGSTMSRSASVADQDVLRLLQAFATKYPDPQEGDKDGPYLVSKWIEEVVVDAFNYVKTVEQAQAAKQASDNISLISFTLGE